MSAPIDGPRVVTYSPQVRPPAPSKPPARPTSPPFPRSSMVEVPAPAKLDPSKGTGAPAKLESSGSIPGGPPKGAAKVAAPPRVPPASTQPPPAPQRGAVKEKTSPPRPGDALRKSPGDNRDTDDASTEDEDGNDEQDTPPMSAARKADALRELERELKKDHLRQMLALEERMQELLAEKNARLELLEELLADKNADGDDDGGGDGDDEERAARRTRRMSAMPALLNAMALAERANNNVFPVELCCGHGLPEPPLLGASLASQGPLVAGNGSVQPVGTVTEFDRIFRSPAEVRAFFREHFPWGALDQPLRAGKRAYTELMEAFTVSQLSCAHLHMRLAASLRATLPTDARLAPSYMELLEAANKPADFDLFLLDCGGSEVVSSVVAGGAIFLITYPGTENIHAWRLARIGQRRFRAMVAPADERAKAAEAVTPGTAEARMLKAHHTVLDGALSVLLKMHLNLNAYPGHAKYTGVPVRSKVFGRVAAVEGAAEFLVEHGWVDDGGPKILFQGSAADVDRAVVALERMIGVVAKKKERVCPGTVVVEGGSHHGSVFTWDEWRAADTTLYQSWITSVNRRSLALPLKLQWRPLHLLVPADHAMRQRLRMTIGKSVVRPPPVTDLLWVCADDIGDVALRLPHNFVPLLRFVPPSGAASDAADDLAYFPEPPRTAGHRKLMFLCYRTGSVATRLPVTGVAMVTSPTKGDELVKCACGFGVPDFGSHQLAVTRRRGELPVLGIAIARPLRYPTNNKFEFVCAAGSDEPFNFLPDTVDPQHVGVRTE